MAKKNIYFDEYCGYVLAAITEDGLISEFAFEKRDRQSIIGNVYKGTVVSVLPGMQAFFIDCGLERNCYMAAGDFMPDAVKYEGKISDTPAFPQLKEGDSIAVQVIKAPMGKKGARVTAFPSFVGKNLIYMPRTPFVGVSRKITDSELRKNLIYSAGKLISGDEGLIFRTAAPYARLANLEIEFNFLKNMYNGICNAFEKSATGTLLYTDVELPMRIMRDTLSYDIECVTVGSPKLEKIINDLVNLHPPEKRFPVVRHDTGREMMNELGLSKQISQMISPRVDLENGAYLVIEKTEALTVIDVNTGKFTGEDNLEHTVYYTNILAAREIARQVKLRNIGGIVVVDFIDMNSRIHERAIVDELEKALKKDTAKCRVSAMSEFGLVEFTRKRSGVNPVSLMTKPCRSCRGGHVKSPEYILLGIRAELMNMYADGQRRLRVDLNADMCEKLRVWQELNSDLKNKLAGAELYAVPHRSYSDEQYAVRTELAPLHPSAVKIL